MSKMFKNYETEASVVVPDNKHRFYFKDESDEVVVGGTATHIFHLDFSLEDGFCSGFEVIYTQGIHKLFEFFDTENTGVIDWEPTEHGGTNIFVKLRAEHTLQFDPKKSTFAQLRLVLENGQIIYGDKNKVRVIDTLTTYTFQEEDEEEHSDDYNKLNEKLNQETSARISADNNLQTQINAIDVSTYAKKTDLLDYAKKEEIPEVPTKVSELENDAGYLTEHQDISGKQDKLTAGDNITIINNVISATGGGSIDPEDLAKYIEFGVFKVDGEVRLDKEINLSAGKVYELSGYLKDGHIKINGPADDGINTQLILGNLYIQSDVPQAIYSNQSKKKVVLTTKKDAKVEIYSSTTGTSPEDDSFGVIQAEGNMAIITGENSTVYVKSNILHEHAIKASRLYLEGAGSVKVYSGHDGFHGGKLLRVDSGNYCVEHADVDGLEAKYIQILGGNITVKRCYGDAISSKDSRGVIAGYTANINILNESSLNNIDVLETVPFEYTDKKSLENYFGTAIIKESITKPVGDMPTAEELASWSDVSLVDGKYTTSKLYVYTSGYFANQIVFNIAKSKWYSDNACVKTSEEASVIYSAVEKKLECKAAEDAILLVINDGEGDAIKSNSSVGLQENGNYIFKANTGKCINNINYLFTKGDGVKYFLTNGDTTIKAARFTIGADHADIAEDAKVDMFEIGPVEVNNKIVLEPNSVPYCDGKLYYAYGQIGFVKSNGFNCIDVVRFWKENLEVMEKENSITVIEAKSDSPTIDAYTKEEADARFAVKALENTVLMQAKMIQKLEDRFAHELYPTYPYITYIATDLNPIVVRGNEGTVEDPVFTDGSHTVAISKDGRYIEGDGDTAQFNVIVTCPDGQAPVLTGYDNWEYASYNPESNQYRVKCKKLTGDISIEIIAKTSYNVELIRGTFDFEDAADKVAEGENYIFKIVHNSGNKTHDNTLDSVFVGEADITEQVKATLDAGKNKDTFIINAELIDADIKITSK